MTEQPDHSMHVYRELKVDGIGKLVVTNFFFDMPLYGLYVFDITDYSNDVIEGTLMDLPFDIHGPFDTFEAADDAMRALGREYQNFDNELNGL